MYDLLSYEHIPIYYMNMNTCTCRVNSDIFKVEGEILSNNIIWNTSKISKFRETTHKYIKVQITSGLNNFVAVQSCSHSSAERDFDCIVGSCVMATPCHDPT